MPENRGRNAQLLRLLSIIMDLDRLGGVDLYELAQCHGATVRTIRRDLEALERRRMPGVRPAWPPLGVEPHVQLPNAVSFDPLKAFALSDQLRGTSRKSALVGRPAHRCRNHLGCTCPGCWTP